VVSLRVGPHLEMYKMAGFDAGNALADYTSADPLRRNTAPNPESDLVIFRALM
jgi:hypothetical protein